MAPLSWQSGTVIRIVDETYNTRRYFIQFDEVGHFQFRAGQFITLDLPIDEKPSRRWRSYSIASAPDGSNIIELLIVLLEGGAGSTYIFNEIKVGSKFTIRGPQGVFTLPEQIEQDLFFVCTGTGIAPFRSMLFDIYNHGKAYKNLYLLFGCRTQKDLLYQNELKSLENYLPGFSFIPTLSREQWEGRTGYVHSIYQEICGEKILGCRDLSKPSPATFYLCGWKFMIEDAKKNILEMGYTKGDIRLELYG